MTKLRRCRDVAIRRRFVALRRRMDVTLRRICDVAATKIRRIYDVDVVATQIRRVPTGLLPEINNISRIICPQ